MKLKFLALFGMIWLLEFPANAAEEAYLCRTAGPKWEKDERTIICHYLDDEAPVTWNAHTVYGEKFKNINDEIASQKEAMKSFNCQSHGGNMLTVILAATGRNNSNKTKGYYANLRIHLLDSNKFKFDVSCDEQNQVATFCSESFYNSQESGDYSQCVNN